MGDARDTTWPLSMYRFSVEIPDLGVAAFQEISGLDIEPSLIQYHRRIKPGVPPPTIKVSGGPKTGTVTMKRGVFARDNKFWEWQNSIARNQAKPTTVTIKLIDESGNPAMTWTLANALPTKISGADLNATGNDVVIETLEITHERLAVSKN